MTGIRPLRILFSLAVFAGTDLAADTPQSLRLELTESASTRWNKDRLTADPLPDQSGLRVYYPSPEQGPFDDTELFRADSAASLPYGRKQLSVTVEVGARHRPLWENKLLQFQLNGRELAVADDNQGRTDFEKDIGGDGKPSLSQLPSAMGGVRQRLMRGPDRSGPGTTGPKPARFMPFGYRSSPGSGPDRWTCVQSAPAGIAAGLGSRVARTAAAPTGRPARRTRRPVP